MALASALASALATASAGAVTAAPAGAARGFGATVATTSPTPTGTGLPGSTPMPFRAAPTPNENRRRVAPGAPDAVPAAADRSSASTFTLSDVTNGRLGTNAVPEPSGRATRRPACGPLRDPTALTERSSEGTSEEKITCAVGEASGVPGNGITCSPGSVPPLHLVKLTRIGGRDGWAELAGPPQARTARMAATSNATTTAQARPRTVSSGLHRSVSPDRARSGGRQARTQNPTCSSAARGFEDAAWRSSGAAISGGMFRWGPLEGVPLAVVRHEPHRTGPRGAPRADGRAGALTPALGGVGS